MRRVSLLLMLSLVFVASTASATASSKSKSKSAKTEFFVVNGTANAASDHEILGSSAFPNFSKGAVDNYYSMAHAHVDNSPFAEGTASPADTGPIGQTAAAGNTQQPQYADARWPGKDSGKANYGNQGGPYAAAEASSYHAAAEAQEATSGLSGPPGTTKLAVPKGFDDQLRQALGAWTAKWQGPLDLKKSTGAGTPPVVVPTIKTPVAPVKTPAAPVGGAPVKVPSPPAPAPVVPAPPAVPTPTVPSTSSRSSSRSLASYTASSSPPKDGASSLESSTEVTLDSQTGTLVTRGESSLGRVSIGGGQIVIEGIHVMASIANDGTSPKNKVVISIASATIGGVPVTIDQDGVHVAGQGHDLPYQQASDALNTALSHAGIQLFLVAPEISKGCDQSGSDSSSGSGSTTTTTTTSSSSPSDQSGTTTGSCDQSGDSGSSSSSTCDQSNTSTSTTSDSGLPLPAGPGTSTTSSTSTTTTTTTSDQSSTTTSSCGDTSGSSAAGSCGPASTTTTAASDQAGSSSASNPTDFLNPAAGAGGKGEETITATGLHVVFTQPVNQSGVPAQNVEHILGEVFLDSLAVPAGPLPKLPPLSSSSLSSSSSCLGGTSAGGASSGGSFSSGGSASSGPLSSGSTFGSTSQPTSGSTGTSLPAAFATALRKPLWLLLAYLIWQALVIGTGVSLWNWRRGDAS